MEAMALTPSTLTEVRAVEPAKALAPMEVTVAGSTTEVAAEFWNASLATATTV